MIRPPPSAASGPKSTTNPRLDHIEIVLDHDDRVAFITQTLQHDEKLRDVAKCSPVVGSSRITVCVRVARFESSFAS